MAITNPSLTVADVLTLIEQREGPLTNLMGDHLLYSQATITGATKANPCVLTFSAGHDFYDGDSLALASISGMTDLNGTTVTATVIDDTNISIGVDSSEYGAYTSGGTATRSRTGWTDKITAAWNMVMSDLRNLRGLDTDLISVKDSDDATNNVQTDLNLLTALLAMSFIFGDASENVGADMADRYTQKAERYYADYTKRMDNLIIDYDTDEDGPITEDEEDKVNPPRWTL